MKIKLISPLTKSGLLAMRISADFLNQRRRYGGVPLALSTLAGLTPDDIEVSAIDENIETIDFEEEMDLVGITFNVAGVIRAYEIADEFKKRGVTVVLGGVYTSMLPQEAIEHADAIVIGEAEESWEKVISDFQKSRLQKIYQSALINDLKDSPIPRWDLLKSEFYNYFSLQTTRGCPHDCDFCSVTYLFGRRMRHKPIENVIDEIKFLKSIDKNKLIFFVDDNIIGDRLYAKELFEALIPLKIRWFGQAPLTVARDDELLTLMRKSGSREVFIGFESISQGSLEAMGKGKTNKVEEYEKAIEKIYSHGISIFGSFMFGGEYDDETIFEKTANFINDNNIPFSLINILVPPPGTRLFQRLEGEGRILHKNWSKYTGEFVCFKPKMISPQILQDGYLWLLREVYSYNRIYERLKKLWQKGLLVKKKITLKDYILRFILTMKVFNQFSFKKSYYFIRCLWDPKHPSITPILLGDSIHEYIFNRKKEKV